MRCEMQVDYQVLRLIGYFFNYFWRGSEFAKTIHSKFPPKGGGAHKQNNYRRLLSPLLTTLASSYGRLAASC